MSKYLICFVLLIGCSSNEQSTTRIPEEKKLVLISPLGVSFYEPEWTAAQKAKLDSNLTVAVKNFEREPSEDNYVWLGRRLGYVYRLDSAIQVFSSGIERYPASYRLYRHRGHRLISIRKFKDAISDFEKAVALMQNKPIEIEPDGQPNKLNIPLSNTQFNVWYHLGLAYYLTGDFANAEKAYDSCMLVSDNDDLRIATADWLYMTLRRLGKTKEAQALLESISDSPTIVENDSYDQRLLLYKGKLQAEKLLNPNPNSEDYDLALATQGYGVANWYLYNGDSTKAKEIFTKIVGGKHFSSFGFIAAEADLVRMK